MDDFYRVKQNSCCPGSQSITVYYTLLYSYVHHIVLSNRHLLNKILVEYEVLAVIREPSFLVPYNVVLNRQIIWMISIYNL
jgi:hypothetical protein